MKINSEINGPQWSYDNDKRITKIGHILRKTRIDEIPQLFSVIKGEMSLIGPRPERPEIDSQLEKIIIGYKAGTTYYQESQLGSSKLSLCFLNT